MDILRKALQMIEEFKEKHSVFINITSDIRIECLVLTLEYMCEKCLKMRKVRYYIKLEEETFIPRLEYILNDVFENDLKRNGNITRRLLENVD